MVFVKRPSKDGRGQGQKSRRWEGDIPAVDEQRVKADTIRSVASMLQRVSERVK
jgi:hypothetical protein